MKSQQIATELAALEAQLNELSRQISLKKKALIEALNNEFSIKPGEKVTIFRGEKKVGTGIFVKIAPSKYQWKGQTEYVISKMKKDGSPSKNEWNQFDFDRIEKL